MANVERAEDGITAVVLDESDEQYGFFPGAHEEAGGIFWSGHLTDGEDHVTIVGSPAALRALAAAATRAADMAGQHISDKGYWGGKTPPPEARSDWSWKAEH